MYKKYSFKAKWVHKLEIWLKNYKEQTHAHTHTLIYVYITSELHVGNNKSNNVLS